MAGGLDLAQVAGRAFDRIGSAAVGANGGLIWLEDGTRADLLYSGTVGWLARLHALRTRPGAPAPVPRPGPSWL